jgi:hypothetical protein
MKEKSNFNEELMIHDRVASLIPRIIDQPD